MKKASKRVLSAGRITSVERLGVGEVNVKCGKIPCSRHSTTETMGYGS